MVCGHRPDISHQSGSLIFRKSLSRPQSEGQPCPYRIRCGAIRAAPHPMPRRHGGSCALDHAAGAIAKPCRCGHVAADCHAEREMPRCTNRNARACTHGQVWTSARCVYVRPRAHVQCARATTLVHTACTYAYELTCRCVPADVVMVARCDTSA